MRFKIVISYIGSAYCGWQRQKNLKTVQGEVEAAIFSLTQETVSLTASGRTDAGVHALGQVAHFDLAKPFVAEKFVTGLNHFLPEDIRVLEACAVPDNFNARKSAKKKTYVYLMYPAETENALLFNRALRIGTEVNPALMHAAAQGFLGTHDFTAFMSSGSEVKTTVRTVTDISVTRQNGFAVLSVTANGFLYNMVRLIVGVLLKAGKEGLTAADVAALIDKKDKNMVHYVAPAYGLYLLSVDYK